MKESGKGLISTEKKQEMAVIAGVDYPALEGRMDEFLDELEQLITTAGAIPVKRFTQKLPHPNPKYYFGSGKLNDLTEWVKSNGVDMVVFDDDLPEVDEYVPPQLLDDDLEVVLELVVP